MKRETRRLIVYGTVFSVASFGVAAAMSLSAGLFAVSGPVGVFLDSGTQPNDTVALGLNWVSGDKC